MLFSSLFFLYAFLPILFILFFPIKKSSYRSVLLVIFSLLFYACGEPVYVLLMIAAATVNYILGILSLSKKCSAHPKLFMALCVILNLGLLGIFKYADFIIGTVNLLLKLHIPLTNVKLPIGISFFTFQAMSYVIDVWRGVTPAQKSPVKLLLYISFFPQLIAGPIVRYQDIAPQLDDIHTTPSDVFDGLFRFSVGLGKKVLIANCCASVVENLISISGAPSLLARWGAALFFTFQIYFDFSGYSDMAIGLGRVFGFRFPENFIYPFVSRNATEFWRRWHISLSTWFKDYLFYPVLRSKALRTLTKKLSSGGHKKASRLIPTVIGLLIVWFSTGLWHGASWNYVCWGLYYFIFLTLEMILEPKIKNRLPKIPSAILSHVYFAVITVFGMAIFYFENDLFRNLGYLFGHGISGFSDMYTNSIIKENIFLIAAAAILSVPTVPTVIKAFEAKFGRININVKAVCKTAAIILLIFASTVRLTGNSYNPFLYFRF